MTEPQQAPSPSRISLAASPRHVGFILDGNRRWARAHGVSVYEGHRMGVGKVPQALEWCEAVGLEVATLWVLSVGNLTRRNEELDGLHLFEQLGQELLRRRRWRVRPVGFLELLPQHIADVFRTAEEETRGVCGMQANIAIAYDGRQEITAAVHFLVAEALRDQSEGRKVTEITEATLSDRLFTRGQPDPDLIIRTSGEKRLSGFMTWQASQSEFYFSDKHWPDFDESDFHEALRSFASRHRRFGS